jgi:hypothetical protein
MRLLLDETLLFEMSDRGALLDKMVGLFVRNVQ